jgi:hypothetical protein
MAEDRRWWERDPVKLWAPIGALVAAGLQTQAYAGYQAFYGEFGVRADEVGFDYAGTLRRSSVPIFVSFALVLITLSLLALIGPPFVRLLWVAGRDDERSRLLASSYPRRGGRQTSLFVVWTFLSLILLRVFHGVTALVGVVIVTGVSLVLDGVFSSARNEPSTWNLFLQPRPQGGLRHLLVLAGALVLGSQIHGWVQLPVFVVAIYGLDRALDKNRPDRAPPFRQRISQIPFGPVTALAVLVVGVLAVVLVSELDWSFRVAHLDVKARQVRAGGGLAFEPFAPFGLIQPQALRVTVTWIGSTPAPPPFEVGGRATPLVLTLFGQDSGTAVFYEASTETVFRLPSGSVSMATPIPAGTN